METTETGPPRIKGSYKLTPQQKIEIAARVAKGETQGDLAREFGVHKTAISHLVRNRGVRYGDVSKDIMQHETTLQKRLLSKTYTLLEKKLDKANNSESDTTPIDKVSSVANDLWKQVQVAQGDPTDITESKSISELKLLLSSELIRLSTSNPIDILDDPNTTITH